MSNQLIILGLCAFIASAIHMLTKIAQVNKMSKGDANYRQFFRMEWPYIAISALTIILALIAHETISKIQAVHNYIGEWMIVIYMLLGWTSDSIFYKIFGRMEKKLVKEINDKTK